MQSQAREKAQLEEFEVFVAKTSFKANRKALAENEGEGLAKVTFQLPSMCIFVICDAKFRAHHAFYVKLCIRKQIF